MADEEDTPDIENADQAPADKFQKVKNLLAKPAIKLALLVLLLLLLLGGTSFATLSYLGVFGTPENDEVAQQSPEASTDEASGEAKFVATVNYYPMEPEFIVNFMARGRQRYMQVGLSLKIADPDGLAQIENHEPLLRNSIVILLSAQDYLGLQSDEGRVALRKQLLQSIRDIMTKETGKPIVDEVFFTSYVLQ